MSEKLKKSTRPARWEEIKRGAVEPEKPTKLPNVAMPRPVTTTVPSSNAVGNSGSGSSAGDGKGK